MNAAGEWAGARAGTLRESLATLLEAAATRVELAAVEVALQGRWLGRRGAIALAMVLCTAAGAALAFTLIVFLTPPEWRAAVVGAACALAFGAAAACAWRINVLERRQAPLLQSTLEVLRADAAALRRHG